MEERTLYEYKILNEKIYSDEALGKILNDHGAEGWKLVKMEGQVVASETKGPDGRPLPVIQVSLLFERIL